MRILVVAVMVATGSLALAHEGGACCCCGEGSDKSFREAVLGEVFPLTREVIESQLQAEEFDTASLRLGKRILVPRMELPRPLGEAFNSPINNDAPPVYFNSPSNDMISAPFDQLVQNDLLPSTMAEMRVPKGVVSTGSGIMYFGGIAFMR